MSAAGFQACRLTALGWSAVALLATAGSVSADFDKWLINEVYSSADGRVQFIELCTLQDDQELLLNHSIASNANTYIFDDNLSDFMTRDRCFLVGTESYRMALGAVEPDYVVPDGFFAVGGDTIDHAGADDITFTMGQLPIDGVMSLAEDFSTGPNSPENFASQEGHVILPEPGAALLQLATLVVLVWIRSCQSAALPLRAACRSAAPS